MDPVSQGVLGAVAAQNVHHQKKHLAWAGLFGWLSGMAPDLDVVFRSASDPLFSLEYHRHFTHSLAFMPVGALICAFIFYWIVSRKRQISFGRTYLWCFAGYATHGLLDSCTTYGTQLFWPFADTRVAWNTISIIDPLFTLPLLLLTGLATVTKKPKFALIALFWVVIYTGLGIIQRERAEAIGLDLARSRAHEPIRLEAKPSFGNILVWKVIYSTDDHYYVDAVKIGVSHLIFEGDSVPILDVGRAFPWLDPASQQAKDIERFRWFSNDYLAISPYHPNRIIDIRYSAIPNEFRGLWGIELTKDAGSDEHITKVFDREQSAARFKQLWQMITAGEI